MLSISAKSDSTIIIKIITFKINHNNVKRMVTFFLNSMIFSDRDRIRTYDRLLRRQMLYPAELRDLKFLVKNNYKKLSGETGTRTQATLSR